MFVLLSENHPRWILLSSWLLLLEPETDAMEIEIQEEEALSPIQPLPASGHDVILQIDFNHIIYLWDIP